MRDIVSLGPIMENPVRWLLTDASQQDFDRITTIRAALNVK